MQKINVGFDIDLEILIKSRMLVQANSGGGKSYLMRKLIEEIHGKLPFIVLDLEGEFTSIREKYDVILFGKGHDVPINIQYADKLARYLLELRVSAIIDLSELMQPERILFVRRFLESMMNAPKNLWNQTVVFIDEAHIFCPEDSKAESSAAVIDLCTRGRKRGYCAVLATQRISKLRKDAVAELNNKLIGRTGMDVDVKRTAFELGMTSGDAQKMLPHLHEGEFYVFGPAISRVVKKEKVSKVKTTHGETDVRLIKPIPPSNAIQKIIGRIADIPKEVEREKDLLKSLQEENKSLKVQVKEKSSNVQQQADVLMLKKQIVGYEKAIAQFEMKQNMTCSVLDKLKNNKELDSLIASIKSRQGIDIPKKIVEPNWRKPDETKRMVETLVDRFVEKRLTVERRDEISQNKEGIYSLGKCERAILAVLAQRQGLSSSGSQVAILSTYSLTSSSFSNALGRLRTLNFIKGRNNDNIQITDAGIEAVGDYDVLPSGPDLHKYWYDKLGKCERAVLKYLVDSHPSEASKEEISQATEYSITSSSFSNALGKLRTLELIEGYEPIKASDSLF